MGCTLASLIFCSKDYKPFYEKAKRDEREIDVQPILKLTYLDDPERRGDPTRFLDEIRQHESDPLVLTGIDNLLAREGQFL